MPDRLTTSCMRSTCMAPYRKRRQPPTAHAEMQGQGPVLRIETPSPFKAGGMPARRARLLPRLSGCRYFWARNDRRLQCGNVSRWHCPGRRSTVLLSRWTAGRKLQVPWCSHHARPNPAASAESRAGARRDSRYAVVICECRCAGVRRRPRHLAPLHTSLFRRSSMPSLRSR